MLRNERLSVFSDMVQIHGRIGNVVQRRKGKRKMQLVPLPELCAYLEMELWQPVGDARFPQLRLCIFLDV